MSKMNELANARQKMNADSPALERLTQLFDEGTFAELDVFAKADGAEAGVITGWGSIDGNPVYAFAQDCTANGGAVGRIHAAKIKKVYDLAMKTGAPVVGIYDSNGAKLTEGNDALAAYGDMMACSSNLSGVVPQISLVLGVCAGSAAMAACNADFVIMSEKAELFMTAPFITDAKGEKVEGAGSAENAAKAGVATIVEKDEAGAILAARKLISMLPINNLSNCPICEFTAVDAAEAFRAACEDIENACMRQMTENIADAGSMVELNKGFGEHSVTSLVTLGGLSCGIVAVRGKLDADDSAKICRLVSFCDAFQIPVVSLVNTSGFKASAQAELAGSLRASARMAHIYAQATCPKIAVVVGQAYGPAYIAMAGRNSGSDITLAWPSAVISALEPETAVSILWNDKITQEKSRADLTEEYKLTEASPFKAAADGYIEDVIDPASTRDVLLSVLDMLSGKRVSNLPKKHSNLPL